MDNNEITSDVRRDITPRVKDAIAGLIVVAGAKTHWRDGRPARGRYALPVGDGSTIAVALQQFPSYPIQSGQPALVPRPADIWVDVTQPCHCGGQSPSAFGGRIDFTHYMRFRYVSIDGVNFTHGYSIGTHPTPYPDGGVEYNLVY